MTCTICKATQDGNWLARCLITGTVASGSCSAEALNELRRILVRRKAA